MKIKSIKSVGKKDVYDISVKDAEHYILKNGVVSHNTGIYYSANNIFIIGRQQDKDTEGIKGWNFVMNVEKSRYVKEKSKLIFNVSYEGGISRWGGLLDEALESGHVVKPSNGWYQRPGDDKKLRLADIDNKEFWLPIVTSKEFQTFLENKYQLAYSTMMSSYDADVAHVEDEDD